MLTSNCSNFECQARCNSVHQCLSSTILRYLPMLLQELFLVASRVTLDKVLQLWQLQHELHALVACAPLTSHGQSLPIITIGAATLSTSCGSSLHTKCTTNRERQRQLTARLWTSNMVSTAAWLACICVCTAQLCMAFMPSARTAVSTTFARKTGFGAAVRHATVHRAVCMSAVREVRCDRAAILFQYCNRK